jgi:hypothetical protein
MSAEASLGKQNDLSRQLIQDMAKRVAKQAIATGLRMSKH